MITWEDNTGEYVAYDLAIEDLNSNPDILPNTILDYSYIHHDLNAAVSNNSLT